MILMASSYVGNHLMLEINHPVLCIGGNYLLECIFMQSLSLPLPLSSPLCVYVCVSDKVSLNSPGWP